MLMSVDVLLDELQYSALHDRRISERRPFVRPVVIRTSRGEEESNGFSRDISRQGIGILDQRNRTRGTIAILDIHSVLHDAITLRAEVRWCEPFGKDWFSTGWSFIR